MLFEWELARKNKPNINIVTNNSSQAHLPRRVKWTKPSRGRNKSNIDVSFPVHENKIRLGICIRDGEGAFVLAKTEWKTPKCDVHVGEALGLLSALQ